MYPKPLTGSVKFASGPVSLSGFKRSYPSGEILDTSFILNEIAGAGFGYRDVPTPSDYFNPTAYQIWWASCNNRNGYGSLGWNFFPGINSYGFSEIRPHIGVPPLNFLRSLTTSSLFSSESTFEGASRLSDPFRVSQIAALVTRANNLVLLELADQRVQLGITLAETSKTSRYLLSKGDVAVRGLIALRDSKKAFFRWLKRNYRYVSRSGYVQKDFKSRVQNHLKKRPWDSRLGSRWLEFNYAVMPLVYDINGVLSLYDPSMDRPIRFSVKKRMSTTLNLTYGTSGRAYVKADVNVLVQHNVEIADPLQAYMSKIGVTPLQFTLGTAYELIPFSFVADWFLGFNDLLKGMSAYQGLRYVSGFKSVRIKGVEKSFQQFPGKSVPVNGIEGSGPISLASPIGVLKRPGSASSQPSISNTCLTTSFDVFDRKLLYKPPAYSYSASLDALSKRRVLTLVSLLSVLRRK